MVNGEGEGKDKAKGSRNVKREGKAWR